MTLSKGIQPTNEEVVRRLRLIANTRPWKLWSADVRFLLRAADLLEEDVSDDPESLIQTTLRPLLIRFGMLISGKSKEEMEASITRAENMTEEELDAELQRMLDERRARRAQAEADKLKEQDKREVIAVTLTRRVTLACGHRFRYPEEQLLPLLGQVVECPACREGFK